MKVSPKTEVLPPKPPELVQQSRRAEPPPREAERAPEKVPDPPSKPTSVGVRVDLEA